MKNALIAIISALLSGGGLTIKFTQDTAQIVSASQYATIQMASQMAGHAESRCKALNEFAEQLFDDLDRLEQSR